MNTRNKLFVLLGFILVSLIFSQLFTYREGIVATRRDDVMVIVADKSISDKVKIDIINLIDVQDPRYTSILKNAKFTPSQKVVKLSALANTAPL
jgi:hypothetical protein